MVIKILIGMALLFLVIFMGISWLWDKCYPEYSNSPSDEFYG